MNIKPSETKIVKPLRPLEEFFEQMHQKGLLISSYSLTLNSKEALKEMDVKKCLIHLFRKVPTLSLCIKPESQKLCFSEMNSEKIDFKILEDRDYEKHFALLTNYRFNVIEGPLWCARLLELQSDYPCAADTIKEKYPHAYILLFGFHHAITDGNSNILICNMFLNILNNMIGKNAINDNEKLGRHYSSVFTNKLIFDIKNEIMHNPSELEIMKNIISPQNVWEVKFFQAFPLPVGKERETKSIYYSLTSLETTKLMQICKREGVSVHSAFCTIVNSVIAQMLHDSGLNDNCFTIKHRHSVNDRKYWSENIQNALGPHIRIQTMMVDISPDTIASNFWNNARDYNKKLNEYIREKLGFKQFVLMLSLPDLFSKENDNLVEEIHSLYITSNLGNLDNMFTGEGEHVQVTDIRRSTSLDKVLFSHIFQTFRGRFIYNLDYNTKLVTSNTANLYVTSIFKFLQKVCQD